jgi:hypothetical protein
LKIMDKQNTKTSKIYSEFLSALCETGNNGPAELLGINHSNISRLKTDEFKLTLTDFCHLMVFIGLEVNRAANTYIKVDRLAYDSLITISDFALGRTKATPADGAITINKDLYNALIQLSHERLTQIKGVINAN